MLISDLLPDIANSSWLRLEDVILDDVYGYLISMNPAKLNITRDYMDTSCISVSGDTLPNLCYSRYETTNYAPLIYLLNDNIPHPLYIPPGVEIWFPNPSKIYALFRDLIMSQ